MGAFNSVAAYYELLSDSRSRQERERPLLERWLHDAPGSRIVDLACGSGFHALLLAECGATVTALDLGADMIAHAQELRSHPGITYRVRDMRTVEGGPWDLAICLGNSLSLLGSLDEVGVVMNRVHAALTPGGMFVVQVLNYAAVSAQKPRHRIEERRTPDLDLVAVKSLVPHGHRTLLSLTFHLLRGGQYEAVCESAALLNLSEEELVSAAKQAGFETNVLLGDFNAHPYDAEQSTDLICVFQKAR